MKLTQANIAAIEDLLTRRENGERAASLCPSGGTDKTKQIAMTRFMQTLRDLGVKVPKAVPAGGRPKKWDRLPAAEAEAFRAWKASQEPSAHP